MLLQKIQQLIAFYTEQLAEALANDAADAATIAAARAEADAAAARVAELEAAIAKDGAEESEAIALIDAVLAPA
jgi:hypothetical protein